MNQQYRYAGTVSAMNQLSAINHCNAPAQMTPRGDGVNSEIEETSEEIGFLRESIASFIDRVQSVSRPQGPAADSGKQAPQPMPSCPVCEKIVALRNSIANLNYMLAEASNRIAL